MAKNKIDIIKCMDKNEASQKALEIILSDIDQDTLLLLSGGTSPDLLYRLIAQDRTLKPGAVALIDERFGFPMHDNSNEKMIAETGLVEYLNKERIPFYRILGRNTLTAAQEYYEQIISDLFKKFSKKVAIMGLGADGHTAGIKPSLKYDHSKLVISYDDAGGLFGQRVTLTFEALNKINEFIILAFGENKRWAIEKMLERPNSEDFPAAYFAGISTKVILLTDII